MKYTENMCIFFGLKNKRPKNKITRFSAPKTKKKTKFGRPLVKMCTIFTSVGFPGSTRNSAAR